MNSVVVVPVDRGSAGLCPSLDGVNLGEDI